MDIHEYQAKALLSDFGVPIATGGLAYSPEQAAYRAKEIGGKRWVVKAQIHSGARGKAGGIRMCDDENDVWEAADDMLGRRLVTNQTGPGGKGVYRLYIEPVVPFERELYLSMVLDRQAERIVLVTSGSGGMEIEELAETERLEMAVLEKYLPAALSADEINAIVATVVAETGASSRADMGKVMPLVQQRTDGRADGKTLSQAVMQALS